MAIAVDPFSFATAELSEDYINVFSNPDIVPKYLESVSDKTGVELLTGYNTLSIKGSWVSLTKAHASLTDFLKKYQNGRSSNDGPQVPAETTDDVTKCSRNLSSYDNETVEKSDDSLTEYGEPIQNHLNVGVDDASQWIKWASEVLPQIQRTRSKRAIIYSEPNTPIKKVPEPLVLYASFQPTPDPKAKKPPTLDEIEKVLKKVYDKERCVVSASVPEHKMTEKEESCTNEEESMQQVLSDDQNSNYLKREAQPQGFENLSDSLLELESAAKINLEPSETKETILPMQDDQTEPSVTCNNFIDTKKDENTTLDKDIGLDMINIIGFENSLVKDEIAQESTVHIDKTLDKNLKNAADILVKENIHLSKQLEKVNMFTKENLFDKKSRKMVILKKISPDRKTRRKGKPKKNEKYVSKRKMENQSSVFPTSRAERAAKRNAATDFSLISNKVPGINKRELNITSVKLKEKSNINDSVLKRKREMNDQSVQHKTQLFDTPVKGNDKLKDILVKEKCGKPPKQLSSQNDEEKTYICDKCSYNARKYSHLREHKRRVHITKEFNCEKCGKVFGFGKDLKRHRKTHQRAENCCDICGKMYKGLRTLAEHKKKHADGYIKPEFPCEFCDKVFSTKYVLAYHIKSDHLGMKRTYLCPTCGKSFSQRNSYLQHANVHMGIKPYQCDVCGKSFSYEKSLKEHRYMHEENKQFECPVCQKKFRQSSGVAIHMKIHKERKDYVCSACGKGFSQKQALIRHERIHLGEKPFLCRMCGRNFTDSSILRRHMILIHKKDPKKWREDTISNITRRTDFFISIMGENGEMVNSPFSDDLTQGKNVPEPAVVKISNEELHNENVTSKSLDYISASLESTVVQDAIISSAPMAPVSIECRDLHLNQSRLQILPHMANSGPQSSTLPVTLDQPSTPIQQSITLQDSAQPLDMSSQNHVQLLVHNPTVLSPYSYGDHHQILTTDFYSSEMPQGVPVGLHLSFPGMLNQGGIGTGESFNSSLVMLPDTLNFHQAPVSVDISSPSQVQTTSFTNLASHQTMSQSEFSSST